jgi:DNA-binding response OmpR family regulator
MPVAVITAHDDPMHRRAARDIAASAYLTKPFSGVSLLHSQQRRAPPNERRPFARSAVSLQGVVADE